METLEIIKRTREYLNYIEEHILNIQKAFKELNDSKGFQQTHFCYDDFNFFRLKDMIMGHDKSKLSEGEFVQYRKSFYPTDIEMEKYGKYPMSEAWEHHKENNDHHWERIEKECTEYGYYQCIHMVIDWTAMGYKFGDTAKEYYKINKEKIKLPDWAVKFIYEIFEMLEEKGEGKT